MAEKDPESTYPIAPPHAYTRSTGDPFTAMELQRSKRKKRIAYIAAFIVLQTIVILVFALVIMRFKSPKFRLRDASFSTFEVGNATNPSINLVMEAQFRIKNPNFGKFKYEDGTVEFGYRGSVIGQAFIDNGRVRLKSTKKVSATVDMSSMRLSNKSDELGSDISGGVLKLTAYSELKGKMQVMKVIKKKKFAKLNCTMDVQISTRTVKNLNCN